MTARPIHLADGLALPLDAVTQTFGMIGRKGAGKTYLATMLAEQMLDAGAQVVAVDCVGVWYGLRIAADGKAPGKEIFVLGGDHGDVALVPEAGARIARLIVEKNVSAVLDVSQFRLHERKRFATDFGEELLHLKKGQRAAMHLFVEEAQLLIPQRVGPDEARMVGAFEQLVRLGRNYGIGCTLVTQRPQSVNKEVLSQVECLCVLQVTGPHERKALEEWVQEVGGERKLVGELPGLARGEGYVWSPAWLRTYKRVRFATKTTFDASATPEVGKAARAASLSAVDVEALRQDLQEVVAAAERDDPKALRRRIAELEAEVRKAKSSTPAPERVEVAVLKDGQLRGLEDLVGRLEKAVTGTQAAAAVVDAQATEIRAAIARAARMGCPSEKGAGRVPVGADRVVARPAPMSRVATSKTAGGDALPRGERVILTAIVQHSDRYEGVSREQLTVLTGYKRSSRDTYLQRLLGRGLIGEDAGAILPTSEGHKALGPEVEPLPTGPALLEHWRGRLPAGERACLDVAVDAYPQAVPRERISERTGYQRSSRDTYLQRLRSRRLVIDVGRGEVRAAKELFTP